VFLLKKNIIKVFLNFYIIRKHVLWLKRIFLLFNFMFLVDPWEFGIDNLISQDSKCVYYIF
jgi:hypothetical protein